MVYGELSGFGVQDSGIGVVVYAGARCVGGWVTEEQADQ